MKYIFFIILLFYFYSIYPARPPELKIGEKCDLYVGKLSGNDPDVKTEFLICKGKSNSIRGYMQWSSLKSGWNKAIISGYKKGGTFYLKDEKFVEYNPKPGNRFCLVDEYVLEIKGNSLKGYYNSIDCQDYAIIEVIKK